MLEHSSDYQIHQNGVASADSLVIMMEQERAEYSCGDYLNGGYGSGSSCDDKITPDDRMKLVDWCYDIVDQCKFERETVAVAMNIADRFMSAAVSAHDVMLHRAEYQLVAVTALYVSIKTNERVLFSSKDFAEVSNGTYSVRDIEDMEWKIFQGLSWRLNPPTSLQVAHQILSLLKAQVLRETTIEQSTWDFIQEEVAFQTENAVRDYSFTTQRPSTIAAAAIMNAIEQVNDNDYEHIMMALILVLKEFNFDSPFLLLEARDQLHQLLIDNRENAMAGIVSVISTEHPQEARQDARAKHYVNEPSEKSPPGSSLFMCTDIYDDNSCATVY